MDAQRTQQLYTFVESALPGILFSLRAASNDASFRNYWRIKILEADEASLIVMNAPPDKEPIQEWLTVALCLQQQGVHVPRVLAHDTMQGFILMEDLGEDLYLSCLDESSVNKLYTDAMDALWCMQRHVAADNLPVYGAEKLHIELTLFLQWFLQRHLQVQLSDIEQTMIEKVFEYLIDLATQQPQVFVHRDYHARNLLVVAENSPGVIDFQDAVCGPITYDLVSLLRDCYIAWPTDQVYEWSAQYYHRLKQANLVDISLVQWQQWFDCMGLQRHLKVLGIFCRLWYRDGKKNYLNDLPRVLNYIIDVAQQNETLKIFANWLDDKTQGVDVTQPIEQRTISIAP